MRELIAGLVLVLAGCGGRRVPAPAPVPSATNRFEVTFQGGANKLQGFLWLPPGAGPHRAVIFNHGSEHDPDDGYPLARFYNDRGFVFFVPVRRGHGKSEGRYVGEMRDEASADVRQKVVVDELVSQVDDVLAALGYLQSRPEVRRDAIAVTGCSFGGIEVVLTAERQSDFKAAVDFAGGAMSWKRSGLLQERMKQAVARATIPIFFVQAENDFDTEPTKVLAAEMERAGKAHEQRIYPARGSTPREGHGFCRVPEGWGPDVIAFLDRVMP